MGAFLSLTLRQRSMLSLCVARFDRKVARYLLWQYGSDCIKNRPRFVASGELAMPLDVNSSKVVLSLCHGEIDSISNAYPIRTVICCTEHYYVKRTATPSELVRGARALWRRSRRGSTRRRACATSAWKLYASASAYA